MTVNSSTDDVVTRHSNTTMPLVEQITSIPKNGTPIQIPTNPPAYSSSAPIQVNLPSAKRRRLEDINYEDAVDVVLQRALEDKNRTSKLLTQLEIKTADKDLQIMELKDQVAALKKENANVNKLLAKKKTECKKVKQEALNLMAQGEKMKAKAKELVEHFSSDMDVLFLGDNESQ